MKPTRILITGGSSYLGQHLIPLAVGRFEVGCTYFQHDLRGLRSQLGQPAVWALDLRLEADVQQLVRQWRPSVIIHTAGSDRSPDMTAVIIQGTQHIAAAASAIDARLIHLSSDVIFDGRNAPYREAAPAAPLHEYARAKAEAERIVAGYSNSVIVRTSLIYGLEHMDHATHWVVNSLRDGRPVRLFTDQWRNPVWTTTLGQSCLELADHDFRGTLNIAGRQELNRADFGLRMLDWWGIPERTGLTTGPSTGNWPMDCRLDLTLAAEILKTPLYGVDEVLALHRDRR